MAFLELKGIGKIYVSDQNVAVGIRGVNASFEKGEFVAVTGASGSGKSTLLNVLSGMDTYEEGELYIEGEPTSHYLQNDWEEYRKKYISFIFADYNILESFTVLQNVEMALMNIEDPRERKKRAEELIDRVGLTPWAKHKGSKLSGGQKQRTVIARALAKDSPIILADEPTGNLDSETSKEIISLLKEVSRDKLVVVVTHNFEQVEAVATRHIRVFDGSIESDTELTSERNISAFSEENAEEKEKSAVSVLRTAWSNAATLGKAMFFAKPKLTVFLCFIMLLATFGVFLDCSLFASNMMDSMVNNRLFTYVEGRVIIAPKNGTTLTEESLKLLAADTGAVSYIRFDKALDSSVGELEIEDWEKDYYYYGKAFVCLTGMDYGTPDWGRYPETEKEALLYLPLAVKSYINDGYDLQSLVPNIKCTVVGIKYYADNRKSPVVLLTEEGLCALTQTNTDETGYQQASLFYENDREAESRLSALREAGYFAALSSATHKRNLLELMEIVLPVVMSGFLFFVILCVIAMLVNLCTKKAIRSQRPDVAILRSMGVPTGIVKRSMYIRTIFTLIPGLIGLIVMAVLLRTSSAVNRVFGYIPAWQYLVILCALGFLIYRITGKQIRDLFDESVRKTLRGGKEE